MVVGAGEDRVESSVIEEVTKGVDRSLKGRQEEDGGVCITSDGGVRQLIGVKMRSLNARFYVSNKFILNSSRFDF